MPGTGHTTLISTGFVSFASSCIHDTAGLVLGITLGDMALYT